MKILFNQGRHSTPSLAAVLLAMISCVSAATLIETEVEEESTRIELSAGQIRNRDRDLERDARSDHRAWRTPRTHMLTSRSQPKTLVSEHSTRNGIGGPLTT